MASLHLIAAFAAGAIAVVVAEVLGILFVIRRIIAGTKSLESAAVAAQSPSRRLAGHGDLTRTDDGFSKQGMIWMLEPQKVPNIPVSDDLNNQREILEVSPIQKTAKIKGKYLILRDSDGSQVSVILKGCKVVAVSATSLSSRKWDKRYPIKIESGTTTLYSGSKIIYLYLDTAWEKESWCRALRVASCDDKERLNWFSEVNEDFRRYLRSLTEGYPSLVKPSGFHTGLQDKTDRSDSPPSKVRQLWKKLARKASRNIAESKPTLSAGKMGYLGMEDSSLFSSTKFSDLQSEGNGSESTETETGEKTATDEGTLCWNLLISRLFFDAKSNLDIKNSLKGRIQRTLSNMRTPTYIGAMMCADVDLGNLPPHIHSMRAVPTDMNDMWALEMDVEYNGDLVLYIEVRLEVHDQNFQNVAVDPNAKSSSVAGVTTDLLQGFEQIREEMSHSDMTVDSVTHKDAGSHELERIKSSKSSGPSATAGSRWKSIINSMAKQVAQVPFMLAIRVASLKGTMQLHIKPPPSDQLWFGFTSMPDINFQLESFVGEHKITSGHISLFLVNRFKAAIRETLVLPNCGSLCIPWMLAEKEDWVPRNSAPFVWLKREALINPTAANDASDVQPREPTVRTDEASEGASIHHHDNTSTEKQKKDNPANGHPVGETSEALSSSSFSSTSSEGRKSLPELRAPLLSQTQSEGSPEHHSPSGYVSLKEQRSSLGEDDDGNRSRKMGRKARMLDLGKKMSEKLEEKRRNLEEKSRLIVDRMRGPP